MPLGGTGAQWVVVVEGQPHRQQSGKLWWTASIRTFCLPPTALCAFFSPTLFSFLLCEQGSQFQELCCFYFVPFRHCHNRECSSQHRNVPSALFSAWKFCPQLTGLTVPEL